MTDIPASGPAALRPALDVTSDAAKLRIRARYRSERRFRALGIVALSLTTLFLAFLLVDVIRKGLPVFTAHSLVLDVTVPQDAIDPSGRRDAAAIRGADLYPVTRDAMKAAVPGVQGRSAERTLTRLLSVGATADLVERLVAEPQLIGTPLRTRLLLSDDADMFFKAKHEVTSAPGRGVATPDGVSGTVTVTLSEPGFAARLAAVKAAHAASAQVLRLEAERSARQGAVERAKDAATKADALAAKAAAKDAAETLDDTLPSLLVALGGGLVKIETLEASRATGVVLLPFAEAKAYADWRIVAFERPASERKITDQEIAYLEHLRATGKVEAHFNTRFFTSGDSREPELAGIRGALVGTAWTMLVTLLLCVPIGVLAAIHLEEFAPKNRITDLIEVNINNLAAVPSIVFGLLGLAIFLNFFDLPRSAPLVGGLVLALLVLPTIIIASRAAIKSVPPSIKEAALGVGASQQQAVFHHVLPAAVPGIMTGTIIGMAHALGETAPLLLIGMVAFIVDVPQAITDASTVLPVQIYLWSDLPEPAFQQKTAGAIILMLVFLFVMNAAAIVIRRRFERRW